MLDGEVEGDGATHAEPETSACATFRCRSRPTTLDARLALVSGRRCHLSVRASGSRCDDLASRREARDQLAELQIDVEQPAMRQQQQRRAARAVELVVHLEAVDRGIAGLWRVVRGSHVRRQALGPRTVALRVLDGPFMACTDGSASGLTWASAYRDCPLVTGVADRSRRQRGP
jgi:hypothetical protein